jgi:hypothetical protein
VLAVHESVHDGTGQQREIGELREQHGVEEGGRSGGHAESGRRGQSEDLGTDTDSSRRATITSVVTFSDCAWKFTSTR